MKNGTTSLCDILVLHVDDMRVFGNSSFFENMFPEVEQFFPVGS